MKKNILVLGVFVVLIIAVLCFAGGQNVVNNKTKIVTSFYPMYIASLNLVQGIDEIELQNLTSSSTGCVHDYTLTPEEMMKIANAKAIIINGSGMESFLQDVINNYSELKVIDASINVNEIKEETHGINPHTFISTDNYIVQVQNIYNQLINIFPEFIEKLSKNKDVYIGKLNDLKQYGDEKLAKFKGTNVVAMHNSFEYFANEFGFNTIAVIEHEEGALASATMVAEIIQNINKNNVKIIITEKDSVNNTAKTIANETGTIIVEFNPALTGEHDINSYIDAYKANIDKIANALNGGI